jgi:cytochrome c551/c552
MKVVTMLPNGDFDKMEPFMQSTKLSAAIDMEVGPDGRLYILEYGSGWFSKNPDAGLSRIDYNGGNRPPKIKGIQVDKLSGRLPLKINATVDVRDPENDKLTYLWSLGNEIKKETTEPKLEFTFNKPGDYPISVEVKDNQNASGKSETVNVYAGNEMPTVAINIKGNQTFYFPNKQVNYEVKIEDRDDTSTMKDMNNLLVSADYIEGTERAANTQGHQVLTEVMAGKSLMMSLDCKTCHSITEKSIGPSYTQVSQRYKKDPKALPYLVGKIIKGGGGVWGETAMSAHPDLKENDARQIVNWIMSLANESQFKKSLPPSGTLNATLNNPPKDNGLLLISASYTDKGGPNIKPLTGSNSVFLRSNKIMFGGVKNKNGFTTVNINGGRIMVAPKGTGWFSIDSIDLTGIDGADVMLLWEKPPQSGYLFEVRLDSPEGKKLGEFTLQGVAGTKGGKVLKLNLEQVSDRMFHNVYIVSKVQDPKEPNQVGLQWIQFQSK